MADEAEATGAATPGAKVPRDVQPPADLDTGVPHSARMWDYWLGGTDWYTADEQAAQAVMRTYPEIVDVARQSRYFLGRAVEFLATGAGISQFLDIGTGLPSAGNTPEVAQRIIPAARVVCVDNDPLVLVHARALLTSSGPGVISYIQADVRAPAAILDSAAQTLDFTQPVALMLLGVLGNVPGYDDARAIVGQLTAAVPPGSYLVINDGTDTGEARVAATDQHNEGGAAQYYNRSPEQIEGYFEGLELVEPGVVSTPRWRPDERSQGHGPDFLDVFCGVARKP